MKTPGKAQNILVYSSLLSVYFVVIAMLWPTFFEPSVSAIYRQTWQETGASLSYITISKSTVNKQDTGCILKGRFYYETNNSRLESASLYAYPFKADEAKTCQTAKNTIIKANNERKLVAVVNPTNSGTAFLKQSLYTQQLVKSLCVFLALTAILFIALIDARKRVLFSNAAQLLMKAKLLLAKPLPKHRD